MTKGAERFRKWLFEQTTVSKVDYLLNSGRWAFSMEPRYTIALLAMQRRQPAGDSAFRATGPSRNLTEFARAAQSEGVSIPVAPLGGAGMVPLLPEQRHVDLLAKLRSGVEFAALQSPDIDTIRRGASAASRVAPHRELDATQQKHLFRHPPGGTRLPVWKGESFDQYDPHGEGVAGTVTGTKLWTTCRAGDPDLRCSSVCSRPVSVRTPPPIPFTTVASRSTT